MTSLFAIPVLPLLAAVAALGFGRRFRWGGGELIVGAVAVSLIVLILLPDDTHISATWFKSGGVNLTVGLEVTRLTRFVAMIVAGIALGVGLYSLGYMAEKLDRPRFFAEFGLFIGAMLGLVLANSLVLLFAAWELVGLASYLLISFHYDVAGAPEAAAKAFLMTRIGDMGLLLGWLLALSATGSTDIDMLISATGSNRIGSPTITLMALLMLVGAIGKSAQLPFTGWLPDAMIGPTPVSALLHSATMVAAGVFLVLRLYWIFDATPMALSVLFWIGAGTALVAGWIATSEMDLKRVLAWSTASQLGEMMIALGLGGPVAASFHLAAHAAFKSSLFLAAGVVQETTGTRALDRLGGLIRALPFTGAVFLIAALALAGIPPLSGFWSEETILATAVRHGVAPALLIVALVLLAGIYIGRASARTFFGERGAMNAGQPGRLMCTGMGLLAFAAAILGWILVGRLNAVLPFSVGPELPVVWRTLAIAASIVGLGLGVWRGSSTALGVLRTLEVALDAPIRRIATDSLAFAALVGSAERRLDAGTDRAARLVLRLARNTGRAEVRGFGGGGDALVNSIGVGGEWLRTLQGGRLYLYTLALFIWTAAALVAGSLVLWL